MGRRIKFAVPSKEQPLLWQLRHRKKPPLGLAQRRLSQYEATTNRVPMRPRPKIAEDALARLIDGNRAAKKPPLGSRRTSGLEDGRFGAHSREMSEIPKFHSKMIKGGRWAVAITTGHGPVSYVGNFATEAEAQDWISTNAKDWPQPADKPR
jgi:hypothetical protein